MDITLFKRWIQSHPVFLDIYQEQFLHEPWVFDGQKYQIINIPLKIEGHL